MLERAEYLAEEIWTAWELLSRRITKTEEDRKYLWHCRRENEKEFAKIKEDAGDEALVTGDFELFDALCDIILPYKNTISI